MREISDESKALGRKWTKTLSAEKKGVSSALGFRLLDDFGIPSASWEISPDVGAARAFSRTNSYPVALKIDSPEIPHKTEHGAVIVNIRDDATLEIAFAQLQQRHPEMPVMVQRMARGVEVLLGMTRDPQLGPIVTVGLGGVQVEIFKDVVSLIPPFDKAKAHGALSKLMSFPLLTGFRGSLSGDIERLAEVVARFSIMAIALAGDVEEIEINPLMVHGRDIVAVDCLININSVG